MYSKSTNTGRLAESPRFQNMLSMLKLKDIQVTRLNSRFTFFLFSDSFFSSSSYSSSSSPSFLLSPLFFLSLSFSSIIIIIISSPSISRCFKNNNEEILSSSFGLGCCLVRETSGDSQLHCLAKGRHCCFSVLSGYSWSRLDHRSYRLSPYCIHLQRHRLFL